MNKTYITDKCFFLKKQMINKYICVMVPYLPLRAGLSPNHKQIPTDINRDIKTVITAQIAKTHLDFTSSILPEIEKKILQIKNLNLSFFFFFNILLFTKLMDK